MGIKKSKYNSLNEWKKAEPKAYAGAKRKGMIGEICLMFDWVTMKPKGYWDKEHCIEEAKKYHNKGQWRKNSGSSYAIALKNNWLDICCAHMTKLQNQRPSKTWSDKNACFETAKLFDRPSDWAKNYPGAARSATKNGWFKEMTAHMKKRKTLPNGHWKIKENVLNEAKKYKTKTEWVKNSVASYQSAIKNGWYGEATIHMISEIVREKYLNKINDFKAFNAFIQTKEFLGFFDEFKKTFVYTK